MSTSSVWMSRRRVPAPQVSTSIAPIRIRTITYLMPRPVIPTLNSPRNQRLENEGRSGRKEREVQRNVRYVSKIPSCSPPLRTKPNSSSTRLGPLLLNLVKLSNRSSSETDSTDTHQKSQGPLSFNFNLHNDVKAEGRKRTGRQRPTIRVRRYELRRWGTMMRSWEKFKRI
jgi:hypothetical protein